MVCKLWGWGRNVEGQLLQPQGEAFHGPVQITQAQLGGLDPTNIASLHSGATAASCGLAVTCKPGLPAVMTHWGRSGRALDQAATFVLEKFGCLLFLQMRASCGAGATTRETSWGCRCRLAQLR